MGILSGIFGSGNSTRLNPDEFASLYKEKKGKIIDVRTAGEFAGGHLKAAENIDIMSGKLQEKIKNWDKNDYYFLYCASGNRSGQATSMMRSAGFENVYNVGGFMGISHLGF